MKGATLFGGGEGVGVGMTMAGIQHLWGIEYDADICGVACQNSFNSLHLDATQADPQVIIKAHGWPDILHASPPCPNFSNAKTGGEETELDIALAYAVCRFIEVIKPRIFTLENVWAYRGSKSWERIFETLCALGYGVNYWHLNAANFGVPQTRKRMIVVALRSGERQQRPTATHAKDPKPMFDTRLPWVGWYAAIEDLIPTLPESQFAPWQLERLPDEIRNNVIVDCNTTGIERAKVNQTHLGNEPIGTIPAQLAGGLPRALLVGDQRRQYADKVSQAFTVRAGDNCGAEPRANVQGRVVQMTPRALARFQSFPDWYELPEKKALACRVIGNAVPPLMYKMIIEQVII